MRANSFDFGTFDLGNIGMQFDNSLPAWDGLLWVPTDAPQVPAWAPPTAAAAVPRTAPLWLPAPAADAVAEVADVVPVGGGGAVTGGAIITTNADDKAMHSNIARATYGVDGTGIKIGIISDSYDTDGLAAQAVADGELPATGVLIVGNPPAASDEGRGMAELVHQVAPGAQLYFATGFGGEANMAASILALQAEGCQIIVDDITYLGDPYFQLGTPIDNAIDTVVGEGVSYFTAAGNNNDGYYEAAFTAMSTTLDGIGAVTAENFGTGAAPRALENVTIVPGTTVNLVLEWDQRYLSSAAIGSTDSLSLYLFDTSGATPTLVASSTADVVGQNPVQFIKFVNPVGAADTSFAVAVTLTRNAAPGLFQFEFEDNSPAAIPINSSPGTADPNANVGSGGLFGQALDPNANVVAAVNYNNTPTFGVPTPVVEPFSSPGTGELLFDPTGTTRLVPPTLLAKPNFAAPDGQFTEWSVDHNGGTQFFGTSAAAPNAAAVAALMLQANPKLTPAQITSMLTESAIPTAAPVIGGVAMPLLPSAVTGGAGLIQADTAVQLAINALPAKVFLITSEADLNNALAAIDAGGASASASGKYIFNFDLTGTLENPVMNLSTDIDAIALASNSASVTMYGNGATLDGGGTERGFVALAGAVTIVDLTLKNMQARGGAGGAGGPVAGLEPGVTYAGGGGGGGGGLGGGLFVAGQHKLNGGTGPYGGGNVTLDGVTFLNDQAVGGNGGAGTGMGRGGGGGMGGDGGPGQVTEGSSGGHNYLMFINGGGGGLGSQANGAGLAAAGPGIVPGYASGGGATGAGGGVGVNPTIASLGGLGGGGAGNSGGGFGGGNGGFFGGGGQSNQAGAYGGGGGSTAKYGGGGGGGLGAGGDVFVENGGQLSIEGGSLSGGSVQPGLGTDGGSDGMALGAGIFLESAQVSLAPQAGETLTVSDAIADEAGAGTVIIGGLGTVVLNQANSFNGQILLQSGTLDLAVASAAGTNDINWSGIATLKVEAGVAVANTIDNFGSFGSFAVIDAAGVASGGGPGSVGFAGGVLSITGDAASAALTLSGAFDPVDFQAVSDGFGGTEVTYVACFAEGTRVLTETGEREVERLQPGMRVVSLLHRKSLPIVWVGHRRLHASAHPRPAEVWPVRVCAGAFAPGVPHRFLWLSPDHAVYVAPSSASTVDGDGEDAAPGVLIPVRYLINGATIVQERCGEINYFHVELAAHGVLLAEGLPAESYLDTGNRAAFANGGAAVRMDADCALRVWEREACAKLVVDGPAVVAVRERLLARAHALGWSSTDAPAPLLFAGGQRILPHECSDDAVTFPLPPDCRHARLLSRATIPAHLYPRSTDHRRLGLAVTALALDGTALPLDSARLGAGWHVPEPGLRWTDGAAELVLAGERTLAVRFARLLHYWTGRDATNPGRYIRLPAAQTPCRDLAKPAM
jgi:hypothetical protein